MTTLFPFDDSGIPLTYGLQLGLVQGHREGILIRPSEPGKPDCVRVRYYGTVICIDGEFRMWYMGHGDQDEKYRVCYAVSQDGIVWEKPELGLIEYSGNTRNNLVDLLGGEHSVSEMPLIHDPEDPDPARRFKMAFESEKYYNRIGVAFSADGLHWEESPLNPVTKHSFEQSGLIKFNGCYYVNGQGGGPRPGPPRQMLTHMSYDFEHWTEATALSFQRRGGVTPLPSGGHAGEQVHLKRARDEQSDEEQQKDPRAFRYLGIASEGLVGPRVAGRVILAKDQGHNQADTDTKDHREDDPSDGDIHAEGHAGIGYCQDVDGRADEQEGDGRTQPGALLVDARKEGHDGTGAHSQNEPSQRCRGIRDVLVGFAAQIAGDGFAGHQGSQPTGDKERRQQAEQHVCGEIGGQVAQATLKQTDDIA